MRTYYYLLLSVLPAIFSCNPSAPPSEAETEQLARIEEGELDGIRVLAIDGIAWQAENLAVEVPDSWCYGDNPDHCGTYGRLYRWAAARAACESLGTGWRLPTDVEWQKLAQALGGFHDWLGDRATGDPLKGNKAFLRDFGARLGGWRGTTGGFDSLEKAGFYWTATSPDEVSAWYFQLAPSGGKLLRRQAGQEMGMSCRCVYPQ